MFRIPCEGITTNPPCTTSLNIKRCAWNPINHKCTTIRIPKGPGKRGQSLKRTSPKKISPKKNNKHSPRNSPINSPRISPPKISKKKFAWVCEKCNKKNFGMTRRCTMCQTKRPIGSLKRI